MKTLGQRIEQRRKAMGITSQAELARRAGVPQGTLNGIINRPYKWSPHLARIAAVLKTSIGYLTGETDDPAQTSPPELDLVLHQHLFTLEALPNEDLLTHMFERLLAVVDRTATVDVLARDLAQRLPTALPQLQGPLIEPSNSSAATRRGAPRARATEAIAQILRERWTEGDRRDEQRR